MSISDYLRQGVLFDVLLINIHLVPGLRQLKFNTPEIFDSKVSEHIVIDGGEQGIYPKSIWPLKTTEIGKEERVAKYM